MNWLKYLNISKYLKEKKKLKEDIFIKKISMELGYYLIHSKLNFDNLKEIVELGEKNRKEKGETNYTSLAELIYKTIEKNDN